jgi:hypothetical protein
MLVVALLVKAEGDNKQNLLFNPQENIKISEATFKPYFGRRRKRKI